MPPLTTEPKASSVLGPESQSGFNAQSGPWWGWSGGREGSKDRETCGSIQNLALLQWSFRFSTFGMELMTPALAAPWTAGEMSLAVGGDLTCPQRLPRPQSWACAPSRPLGQSGKPDFLQILVPGHFPETLSLELGFMG